MATNNYQNIRDKEVDKIRMYTTYSILYANDMACSCINDINLHINEMDKEDKKKYNAVLRRVRTYQKSIQTILDKQIFFLADYFSKVDDSIDIVLDDLREAVKLQVDKEYGKPMPLLCSIEVAKIASHIAIQIMDKALFLLSSERINACALPHYRFTQPTRIIDDLARWQTIKNRRDKNIEDYSSIIVIEEKLKSMITDRDTFNQAYEYALIEEDKSCTSK